MRKRLHVQIASVISFGALIMAVLSSWLIYQYSFNQELKKEAIATRQLLNTIQETAAIAIYLNEKEMAREVVNGLARNSIVSQASISLNDGTVVKAGAENPPLATEFSKKLFSPFNSNEMIGAVSIIQSQVLIDQRAQAVGLANAYALGGQTLIVALLTVLLIYRMLTRPIKAMAKKLHQIQPGSNDRLLMVEMHKQNELGTLIGDINKLLESVQTNISNERALRGQVESLEAHYRRIFQDATVGISLVNQRALLVAGNASFLILLEKTASADSIENQTASLNTMFVDQDTVGELISDTFLEKNNSSADFQLSTTDDAEELWVHCVFSLSKPDVDESEPLVEIFVYDITERYIRQLETEYNSIMDHLTGLLNRRGAEQELETLIQTCYGFAHKQAILLLLDLDGFKAVNDVHGHDAGDVTLVEIGSRLARLCRKGDHVGRWGGDEFVVIICSDMDLELCFQLANKILLSIAEPIPLPNDQIARLGASIGISICESNSGLEQERMIKHADMAMYEVKKSGKNGAGIYRAKSNDYMTRFFQE